MLLHLADLIDLFFKFHLTTFFKVCACAIQSTRVFLTRLTKPVFCNCCELKTTMQIHLSFCSNVFFDAVQRMVVLLCFCLVSNCLLFLLLFVVVALVYYGSENSKSSKGCMKQIR